MTSAEIEIIGKAMVFVQEELEKAEAGHDWFHIERVLLNSRKIAAGKVVDHLVVELGALLHDIGDSKFYHGDEEVGKRKIRAFLKTIPLSEERKKHLTNIVNHISFRNSFDCSSFSSPELEILQDADRLDAIGAIGIARAFSYGGYKGNPFYNPKVLPNKDLDKETYKKADTPTINHFYEKLLKLKSMMNTKTGKELAQKRHDFMILFLHQFYSEAGIDPAIYGN